MLVFTDDRDWGVDLGLLVLGGVRSGVGRDVLILFGDFFVFGSNALSSDLLFYLKGEFGR